MNKWQGTRMAMDMSTEMYMKCEHTCNGHVYRHDNKHVNENTPISMYTYIHVY